MNVTKEIKKQKAIELMNKLNIYKPYIKGFEKDNHICFFEGFGGFWAYQEPELMAKIKEFEEKHNVLVYAVTHEYTEFGECYDFLFISDYEEEWGEMLYRQGRTFYAYAYVWNKTDDYCSEFGTIVVLFLRYFNYNHIIHKYKNFVKQIQIIAQDAQFQKDKVYKFFS